MLRTTPPPRDYVPQVASKTRLRSHWVVFPAGCCPSALSIGSPTVAALLGDHLQCLQYMLIVLPLCHRKPVILP